MDPATEAKLRMVARDPAKMHDFIALVEGAYRALGRGREEPVGEPPEGDAIREAVAAERRRVAAELEDAARFARAWGGGRNLAVADALERAAAQVRAPGAEGAEGGVAAPGALEAENARMRADLEFIAALASSHHEDMHDRLREIARRALDAAR